MGSLRKVAATLNITQPAITVMLQDLESVFGQGLVRRDRKGACLTDRGEDLRQRLMFMSDYLKSISAEVHESVPKLVLRVGVLAMAMIDIMPKVIARLRAEYPNIELRLSEGTVSHISDGVLKGHIDCALGRFDSQSDIHDHDDYAVVKISDIPLQVAASVSHPLVHATGLSIADLQQFDWIINPKGSHTRNAFDLAFLQDSLIPPRPVIESASFYSNFHVVSQTQLLTLASAEAIRHYSELGLIAPLHLDWSVQLPPLVFFYRKDRLVLESLGLFKRVLLREAHHGSGGRG